jgi:hypothetical protein
MNSDTPRASIPGTEACIDAAPLSSDVASSSSSTIPSETLGKSHGAAHYPQSCELGDEPSVTVIWRSDSGSARSITELVLYEVGENRSLPGISPFCALTGLET